MISQRWPLFGLRVMTPRLELRLPGLDDLAALAALAADGVHDPAVQPFTVPWTDADPDQRAQSTMQYHWRSWGTWQPAEWSLDLVTTVDGQVVGTQSMNAREFATLRQVATGSWLGRAHHGHGIGTEMRAAVLHLAFAGLGAEYAVSSAYEYNAASLAVSRKLGYADDGIERHVVRGRPVILHRVRLDRDTWMAHRAIPVEIHGLEPCLAHFGL
jgi:RimJ/RimL family protein N-acetyltransferase